MQCVSERLTSSHRACSSRLPALPRGCCGPQPRACVAARQQLVTCAAYAAASPSLPANAAATMASPASSHQGPRTSLDPMAASPASKQQAAPRTSLDPMAAAWEEAWAPGRLLTVKSPDQFAALQAEHPEKLIVLMCKSHACRPCKMFTRKYLSIATRFPDCILAEIYGDETPDTRKMMMQMDVRVTPTFRMYRGTDCVNVTTGTNDKKLMRGILSTMTAAELAAHEAEIADTMSLDEADQQPPAAEAAASS